MTMMIFYESLAKIIFSKFKGHVCIAFQLIILNNIVDIRRLNFVCSIIIPWNDSCRYVDMKEEKLHK